jgi:hypothetical protein
MASFANLRPHAAVAAMAALVLALPHAALAQSGQQNVTGSTQSQAGGGSGGNTNEHGWPTDYVAHVGAGTTNGATTGYSGPEDTQTGNPEPSLPDLPSPGLCDPWEGTEAFPFCMEKLVR